MPEFDDRHHMGVIAELHCAGPDCLEDAGQFVAIELDTWMSEGAETASRASGPVI